jgi:diguanylate cyclase (GGDEF)-like protein/PAS domain S-box-containing protein
MSHPNLRVLLVSQPNAALTAAADHAAVVGGAAVARFSPRPHAVPHGKLLQALRSLNCQMDCVTSYETAQRYLAEPIYDICLLEITDEQLSAADVDNCVDHWKVDHWKQLEGYAVPLIALVTQPEMQAIATTTGVADCLLLSELTPGLLERSMRYAIAQARLQSALEQCQVTQERYAIAVQGSNDGIWDWDLASGIVHFSERWKAMLGYSSAENSSSEISTSIDEWFKRIHAEDFYAVKRAIAAHLDGMTPRLEIEYRLLHQDGSYRWMLCRGMAIYGTHGHATRIAGSQTDIATWKQAEETLSHAALHDTLTGLPNRVFLMERMRQAVQLSQRDQNYLFAVLFVDLDRFKVINDSLGHMIGDQLLQAIAQRLSICLNPGDCIARLGGDEFVILLADVRNPDSITVLAEKVLQELTTPFTLEGHEVFTGASIGIAFSSTGYDQPEDLLRDADIAMYRAKAHGRARYAIFQPGMHSHAVALLQMENDLRRAIARRELELHYQPIVSLRSRNVTGFEALVRWNHPQRGMVSPGEFVPLAEETGLITSIGWWVLREACQQMQAWRNEYPTAPQMTMNVNLSGKQFTTQLADQVRHILSETKLPPQYLKLEITESMLMENPEAAVNTLTQLKQIGVQIAIDDFGTGYSSLNYLHRFPIDTLKVDKSFVSRVDVDGEQLAIVRTIITLAWNLGMEVVAEGVETMKQFLQLRSLQCDYAQGYFFYRPLKAEAIAEIFTTEWQAETPQTQIV